MSFSKTTKEIEKLETENSKYCPECKKIKPLYEFNSSTTSRKFSRTYCRECDKKKKKKDHLLRTYGITLKDYDKLLEKQNGKCKICKTKIPGGYGRFCVDHNHSTNKIRGLLCNNCNVMLGRAKDDVKILAAAIQYLIDSRKS